MTRLHSDHLAQSKWQHGTVLGYRHIPGGSSSPLQKCFFQIEHNEALRHPPFWDTHPPLWHLQTSGSCLGLVWEERGRQLFCTQFWTHFFHFLIVRDWRQIVWRHHELFTSLELCGWHLLWCFEFGGCIKRNGLQWFFPAPKASKHAWCLNLHHCIPRERFPGSYCYPEC